ncbi:MAG: 16S rRNA (adenine(1518)-N(6)/adenine(1519)-N(6))-dimethyltransferase RsmA [Pseudomonadota bacterium]
MSRGTHRARKRFGQHFLTDVSVIRRILDAVADSRDHAVIEIGPGLGALTEALARRSQTLSLIEIDRDLAARLREQYADSPSVCVVEADVLSVDWQALLANSPDARIVGNLPYNISTPLLFRLVDVRELIHSAVFMLQKEVVDRMVAAPGSRTYGRLSVMLQARFSLEHLFDVPPECFDPPPKVDSAVVYLEPLHTTDPRTDSEVFAQLVTQAFSQRRKTIRNSLRGLIDTATIESLGIDPGKRPEALAIDEFATLAGAVAETN